MKAEHAAALLEADALLPVKQSVKTRAEIDTISARSYSHPGLAGTVVRLTADSLAQGEDLALEFLGFETPEVSGPVAQRKRQALGFPGWALIHDPDHARYALELVKEFRKEARRAKSKPGHGYDGIQAIAKKLNRSVAHFLPSFWEEAGRVFIEYGNASYASRCFGKAREAEKVHALKVDEDVRRSAFLEFALAGCLTIKALTEYSKELEAAYGAEEAWGIYRELIVRRTLGGMPPWAAMAKDVKRVAKAAKLDYDEILKGLLREIIDSPAMARAEISFWKNCGGVIKSLAQEDTAVAKALLSSMPETSYWDSSSVWEWLRLLNDWELLPILYGEGEQAALPDESLADWFSKYCCAATRERAAQELHDLLPKVAPKLKKDGNPLKPYGKRWGDFTCDVDLIDLALELGVEVDDPPSGLYLQLDDWAEVLSDDDCPENRPRDPLYMANDERFAPALKEAVSRHAGNAAFEAAATGKEALKEARRDWIMELTASASTAGLPDASDSVKALRSSTSRQTFVEFPEAYEQLKQADVGVALANTLRAGILDEYGWPSLEEAVEKLAPESKKDLKSYGSLPYAIVTNGLNVIVVDRDSFVLECDLEIKKNFEIRRLDFYDGDLLVTLQNRSDYATEAYWASNPKKKLEASWQYREPRPHGVIVARPEGGCYTGAQTVTSGDTKKIESGEPFFYDGDHFWKTQWEDGFSTTTLREIDPANGKKGRKSMPAFFEDFLKDGHTIDLRESSLVKIGEAVKNSPLGSKDGTIGWRIRDDQKTNSWVLAEGIDGRKVEAPLANSQPGPTPVGLLDQPGTNEKLIITGANGWSDGYSFKISLWSPDRKYEVTSIGDTGTAYHQGQAVLLSPLFWHLFQVRDLKVSKKLRKLKDKDASALIKAARADLDEMKESKEVGEYKNLGAAVEKLLPGCNERLARGIQGIVVRAARCKTDLDEVVEGRDPEVEEQETIADADVESFMSDALRQLKVGYSWGGTETLLQSIEATAKFFAGEEKNPVHPKRTAFYWEKLLDRLDTKLFSAYWSCEEIHEGREKLANAPWVKFLDVWRQCAINRLPGRLRRLKGRLKKDAPFPLPDANSNEYELWRFYEYKSSKYLFHCEDAEEIYEDDVFAIEYTESDKFTTPPNFTISDERTATRGWSADEMDEFVKLIAEREPPYLTDEQLQRLADGVGVPVAEAALVWCGFPNFNDWSKNFLAKPLREKLNLKVADAQAARQSLKAMDDDVLTDILGAILAGSPKQLWDEPDAVIDRIIAEWAKVVPKRLDIPPNILDLLDDITGWGVDVGMVMNALAAPEESDRFVEGASSINTERTYRLQIESEPPNSFDKSSVDIVAGAVPALFHELPVGNPAREAAVAVLDIAQERLKNPKLLMSIGTRHFAEDKENPPGPAFLSQFGKPKKGDKYLELDDGALVGLADDTWAFLAFRPAKATTAKAKERIRGAAGVINDEEYEPASEAFDRVQLLYSDGYKSMAKRIRKTPVDDGQYEANPLQSAPAIVDKVKEKLKLSEDAAVLYLQTLALFDCTTKKVREWNGWTAAKYNKAAKELVAAELLLEAKRSRAGRKHFLPGGWEQLKAPNLPIESWKLSFYQRANSAKGQNEFPLERITCLKPCHELFEEAWTRVESGDEPSYEEV